MDKDTCDMTVIQLVRNESVDAAVNGLKKSMEKVWMLIRNEISNGYKPNIMINFGSTRIVIKTIVRDDDRKIN